MKERFNKLTLHYSRYIFAKKEMIALLEGKIINIGERSIDIVPSENHGQILVVGLYKAPLLSVIEHIEAVGQITIREIIQLSIHE